MADWRRRLTSKPAPIILLGFVVVILVGAVLLMLPISSQSGEWTSFLDALFMSTSTTCVTGLVIEDTATYWSFFGQLVILILMEIGGLGVITFTVGISMLLGKKVGFMQRWILQESLSAPQAGGILRETRFIIKVSVILQLVGAGLLAVRFVPMFGWAEGLWSALFTSVSAFTGAALDLMGTVEPYSSLTAFSSDAYVIIVVCILIISGGIGFLTWIDIRNHGLRFREYTLQTKLVIVTTAILLGGAFLFFFFYEFSLPQWEDLTLGEQVLVALFQSVAPRTAGFNVVDLGLMSDAGRAVTIFLMFVGTSPGSTGGGIKVTTLAVLAVTSQSVFRGRKHAECFGRRIPTKVQRNAIAVLTVYLGLLLLSTLLLNCVEGVAIGDALFEATSALSTAGMSLGTTRTLSSFGLVILMALMFFGRAGGLTMMYALVEHEEPRGAKYPQESVIVG